MSGAPTQRSPQATRCTTQIMGMRCAHCVVLLTTGDGVSVAMLGIDVGLSPVRQQTPFAPYVSVIHMTIVHTLYVCEHSNMVVKTRERLCSRALHNSHSEHARTQAQTWTIHHRTTQEQSRARVRHASSQHLYTLIIIRAIFIIIYGNVSVCRWRPLYCAQSPDCAVCWIFKLELVCGRL